MPRKKKVKPKRFYIVLQSNNWFTYKSQARTSWEEAYKDVKFVVETSTENWVRVDSFWFKKKDLVNIHIIEE